MTSEPIPPAPTGYIKLLSEIAKHLKPMRCYTKYLTGSVTAGGETTVLEVTGRGVIMLVSFTVDGADADAVHSRLVVESDGEAVEHVSPYEVKELQFLDFGRWSPRAFIHKWDEGAYIYSLCLELHHSFNEYVRVKIRNGDSANATAYRCLVMYGLEV